MVGRSGTVVVVSGGGCSGGGSGRSGDLLVMVGG